MNASRHAFLLLLPALLAPPGDARAGLDWRADYGKALKEAADTGKPVLVVVGTEDCHWCKVLDAKTLSVPEVQRLINERFIVYKIDANRQPDLVKALKVQVYPSLYFAGPNGGIVGYQEGFLEADPLLKRLSDVLGKIGTPDWMVRDYEAGERAADGGDHAKALALLRKVAEDGKSRPVQVHARRRIEELEAREAKALTLRLASRAEADRGGPPAAKELLEQAREDYKRREYLTCLDRCDALTARHADTPEAAEAGKLAGEIRANPEWTKEACEQLAGRLGSLYLSLAAGLVRQGKPEQAMEYLQRIVGLFPGSREADAARQELARLKGTPR